MLKTGNNKVELLGTYGGDTEHACSAWTSTSRDLTAKNSKGVAKIDRIQPLLNMLAKDGHHTPFEKSALHFLCTTEIATHIHLLKHRIGVSINGECLHGDSNVTFVDINGSTSPTLKVPIAKLYEQWNSGRKHQDTELDKLYQRTRIQKRRIRVLNEETNEFEFSNIRNITCSGEKEVFRIILENGKTLLCSEEHRVFTANGWATINNKLLRLGVPVATNGIRTHVKNKPWTFPDYYNNSEQYTRKEFASRNGIKYELCKKWGYIFNSKFAEDTNKDFKKGNIPWNKNVTGYKLNLSDESRELRSRQGKKFSGDKSNFWKGGVTSERAMIGTWTTKQAKHVHAKYNWACQNCGSGKKLHVHHVVPVAYDPSLAYEIDNLISVCSDCHRTIHKSVLSEQKFMHRIYGKEFEIKAKRKSPKRNYSADFSAVVSIESIGSHVTYDLEIAGKWKNFVADGIVVHNSARYKELNNDKCYVPFDWDKTQQEKYLLFMENAYQQYHEVLEDLEVNYKAGGMKKKDARKRAKESARFYLPYGNQIDCDIQFNFRSFYHFLKLRYSAHAQSEVRVLARSMLEAVHNTGDFNKTLIAFELLDPETNLLLEPFQ